MTPPPHGEHRRYRGWGCRCALCREANAAKQRRFRREYRQRNPLPPKQTPEHGTLARYHIELNAGGPTCGPCRAARAAYNRRWRNLRATDDQLGLTADPIPLTPLNGRRQALPPPHW